MPCLPSNVWYALKVQAAAGDMSLFGVTPSGAGAAGLEGNNSDFLRALSQPLLIQTPLQVRCVQSPYMLAVLAHQAPQHNVSSSGCKTKSLTHQTVQMMLETLFTRSREQGAASLTMQEQVSRFCSTKAVSQTPGHWFIFARNTA